MAERNQFVGFMYQTRIFLRVAAVIVVASLLALLGLKYFLSQQLGNEYTQTFCTLNNIKIYLNIAVAIPMLIFFLISAALIAFSMVYISHKIAGPLYRLEQDLAAIGKGNLAHQVLFRKGDEITRLADETNLMTKRLQEYYRSERDRQLKLAALMAGLSKSWQSRNKAEAARLLRDAEALLTVK